MTIRAAIAPGERISGARLFLIAAMAAVAVPTIVSTARDHWASLEGAHGPLILATGAWLLWRVRAVLYREAAPLKSAAWPLALIPPALIYAFARVYRILPLETTMIYVMGVLTAVIYLGPALVRRYWFPFFYLAFLIVPPNTLTADLTLPLKISISAVSVNFLHALGYPVGLSGATIQIGQYELLVRDACAGLGSLLTLCAAGLFYVHLRRDAGVRFGVALLLAIVPIAILSNLVRVLIVVLLTWHFGSAVGQGVAHELAGLMMFCIAMLCMFATDGALSALGSRKQLRDE
jgi:exosortase